MFAEHWASGETASESWRCFDVDDASIAGPHVKLGMCRERHCSPFLLPPQCSIYSTSCREWFCPAFDEDCFGDDMMMTNSVLRREVITIYKGAMPLVPFYCEAPFTNAYSRAIKLREGVPSRVSILQDSTT
jgi:hypothetical protein